MDQNKMEEQNNSNKDKDMENSTQKTAKRILDDVVSKGGPNAFKEMTDADIDALLESLKENTSSANK
jgi:hypothetical protein